MSLKVIMAVFPQNTIFFETPCMYDSRGRCGIVWSRNLGKTSWGGGGVTRPWCLPVMRVTRRSWGDCYRCRVSLSSTKIVSATAAAGGRLASCLRRDDWSPKHKVHCRQGEEEDANQKCKKQIVKFFVAKTGGGEVTRPQGMVSGCWEVPARPIIWPASSIKVNQHPSFAFLGSSKLVLTHILIVIAALVF